MISRTGDLCQVIFYFLMFNLDIVGFLLLWGKIHFVVFIGNLNIQYTFQHKILKFSEETFSCSEALSWATARIHDCLFRWQSKLKGTFIPVHKILPVRCLFWHPSVLFQEHIILHPSGVCSQKDGGIQQYKGDKKIGSTWRKHFTLAECPPVSF